jgi:hypothetical protein
MKNLEFIHNTNIIEFQHNLLQIPHLKAGNNYKDFECEWDPIKLTFLYNIMHQQF